jgi:hypothetical protein
VATLEPNVARPVGAVFFLGIAMVHFLTLPDGFRIEPYIGVSLIIALMMALFGAGAMLMDDRDRVWWYALAEGLLNGVGYVLTRFHGLPLASAGAIGGWFRQTGMALAFCGFMLAALAGGVLAARRHRRRTSYLPVTSAFQRRLAPPPRVKHPAE